ncbi:MAG TPA: GAF and ANTAR domain-containing protein [Nocardioidaceae bacterium]|nr:GAF and ANTAR domain-containing protein [Nocardioidaceae bacterium]
MTTDIDREQRLAATFVELADTLVAEFDIIDFAHTLIDRSVELLHADAAGLMLADQRGELRVLASTTEETRLLELFQLQNDEGPCLDCYTFGEPVVNIDLAEAEDRWPNFCAATTDLGFRSVHALPLRLRDELIGAMNLFCAHHSTLSEHDLALGQALADVATIVLLQERFVTHHEILAEQLQGALNSRVLIEQAKGIYAERAGITVDEAFTRIRTHSRNTTQPLSAVATGVIDGSISTSALTPADPTAVRSRH